MRTIYVNLRLDHEITWNENRISYSLCYLHCLQLKAGLRSFTQTSATGPFTYESCCHGWRTLATHPALKSQHRGHLWQPWRNLDITLYPQPLPGGCPGLWRHSGGWNESYWVGRKNLWLSFWHWKYHVHYAKQLRAWNDPKSHFVAYRGCSHFLHALWINRGFHGSLQEP